MIPARTKALFAAASATWKLAFLVDAVLGHATDLVYRAILGTGDLLNELGGWVGARWERRRA